MRRCVLLSNADLNIVREYNFFITHDCVTDYIFDSTFCDIPYYNTVTIFIYRDAFNISGIDGLHLSRLPVLERDTVVLYVAQ
jgi:hypothetical protein